MLVTPNLSCWSLRKKLIGIIMLSSIICTFVSLFFTVGDSIVSHYQDSVEGLLGISDVLAENGQAALMFSDQMEAKRLLNSLQGHHEISSAWLVNADETVLASWHRSDTADPIPSDYKVEARQLRSSLWSRYADLYHPVIKGTEHIGYVLLKADFTEQWSYQLAALKKGLVGAALTLLIAFLFSTRLQRLISSPIAELTDRVRAIGLNKSYGVRVSQRTNDEIGELVVAFNHMLEEIQKRDEYLIRHQDGLEEEIEARTAELIHSRNAAQTALHIKSKFLTNMSHEIRTPMNAIMGMTHLTLQTDLTAKQRNYLDKIHTSSTWLLGILNDILDFSKLEAGKLRLEHTEFRLETVMQYLADVSTPLLNDKALVLNFALDSAMPAVLLGDSLRLGQVLLNLLSNAIKFTETGTVTVRSEVLASDAKQAYLRFSVSDTGIGLSEQQQSQLFSAFTQADDSTTRKYGGTGLGLSISKELIAAMGGAIGVESRLGFGSRFYFTITLDVQTMINPLLVQTKQPDKYPTLNHAYLLLVEDNPINQEFMPEILGHEGIRVDLANNGEEAIAMIGKNNYSAVLMDCQMPVMDGFEATRLIRADPRFADLPIIAMTANVMKEDIECCLACGMNDHIGKPIDWDLFFQTLERWVNPRTSEPVSGANTIGLNSVKPSPAEEGAQALIPTVLAANAGQIFPQLTGVDLEVVRRQTANDVALYRKILALFCANHEHDLGLIKAAHQAGDYETAIHLAHKLNGSASSMAMATLAGLATELEQAIKQRDDIMLEDLLEKTGTVLTRLITEIHQLESPAGDVTLLQQVMAELSALLANASFITDELLTRLKMLLPDEQRADYHSLIQHTLDTDYPKAQSVLNTLIGASNEQVTTADQDQRPIVLIVDDMRVNQELLVSLLSRDYRTKVAGNGPMALEIAQCIPHPDLVLLDINMPQMDGYEVCRKLQENPLTRDIPVIFVTAASDQASEIQGLQLGAVDYLSKPISPAIALLRVRNQILLRQHEKQLKHIAHYDVLTGIPNRVLLADRMKQAIAQTKREQKMLAVCYLDLDGFKLINDTLGHQAGDQVLIECASRIANMLRESDTVARLGGDEFVILLPNLHHVEECIVTLNRLLETIALPIFIEDQSCYLTVSIGVSFYPGDDREPDALLRQADQAMYVAKQSGKSRYHVFDSTHQKSPDSQYT